MYAEVCCLERAESYCRHGSLF